MKFFLILIDLTLLPCSLPSYMSALDSSTHQSLRCEMNSRARCRLIRPVLTNPWLITWMTYKAKSLQNSWTPNRSWMKCPCGHYSLTSSVLASVWAALLSTIYSMPRARSIRLCSADSIMEGSPFSYSAQPSRCYTTRWPASRLASPALSTDQSWPLSALFAS